MTSKNKYNKYRSFPGKKNHSYHLEVGLSGFLCTCNSKLAEKDCVRDTYNILNEFADRLFGAEGSSEKLQTEPEADKLEGNQREEEEEEEDIDQALRKEVESIKSEISKRPEVRRFQVVKSGANGVIFIRSTVPDPVKLAHTIATSVTQVQKSKHLLRLLPVEVTCKANVEDICSACETLFDKYLSTGENTFAVVYNHRNNDSIDRDRLIEKVAGIVLAKNDRNKVDLKQPKLAILLEVIRNICCVSVVPDFYALKKYNLMELAARAGDSGELK